ncbi:MAG: DUF2975 domain-containing protein [Oscillospiraceae bacterium]|nr:DUF2975 domain-containing protein [Oscillospiraceae bacterium]
MWTEKRSLVLSKCCVVAFMIMLAVAAVLAPRAFRAWVVYMPEQRMVYFRATVYIGLVPAVSLLLLLYGLLHRIGVGEVFVSKNTDCLRYISWCCFAGAAVSMASAFYWFPWCAIGVAAAFMGLIVRVIKNVVAKAVSLQEEADYTI